MNAMTKRLWNALHWARAGLKASTSSSDVQMADSAKETLDVLNRIIGKGHKCDICYKKFEDEDAVAKHLIFQDEYDKMTGKETGEPYWFYKTCRTIANKASKGELIK